MSKEKLTVTSEPFRLPSNEAGSSIVSEYVRRTLPNGGWILEKVGEYDLQDQINMACDGCTLENVIKSLKRNPNQDISVIAGSPAPGQLQYGDDKFLPQTHQDMLKVTEMLYSGLQEQIKMPAEPELAPAEPEPAPAEPKGE